MKLSINKHIKDINPAEPSGIKEDLILNSFDKLRNYCEKKGFKGWDPYDGLNSKLFQSLPYFKNKRAARLAWIQFFKRCPINFRGLTGVKKSLNPKGIALFLSGYCNLAKIDQYDQIKVQEKIKYLADLLLSLSTLGYSGNCWGYNFDWESRAFFQPKFTPTIVVTVYAANALIDAYEITGNNNYLEKAISSKNFILKDLKRTYSKNGNFAFSYSPYDQTSVFNASLLGAKLISRIYSYTKEEELKDLGKKAVAYCTDFQNTDGSWFYSPLPFHQWIDNFHTGFNLECILDYSSYTGDNTFLDSFTNGMNYYLNTFFDKKGRSKYYNDSLFPVDIHAPSQLIVTLSKAGLFEKQKELADRVLFWTINKMQSPKGHFYYQKRKFYTNKIPYMRWSQAWIFYALTYYLRNTAVTYENLV